MCENNLLKLEIHSNLPQSTRHELTMDGGVKKISLEIFLCFGTGVNVPSGSFGSVKSVQLPEASCTHHNSKESYTLKDVYLDWCSTYFTPQTSLKTRQEKATAWQRLSVLGDRNMRELKTSDYQAVMLNAVTMERPQRDGTCRPPRPLSVSGKQSIKKLCSQLCVHAMQDDIINKNYAQLISMPTKDSVCKKAFSKEQIRLLWDNAFDRTVKIILLLIYTGLRINELFSMKHENVHIEERFMVGGLKTAAGRNRFIPISNRILPIVQSFYAESSGCGYLLISKNGSKLSDSNFRNRCFYPTLERLGIIAPAEYDENGHLIPRELTPHSTRYTFFNLFRNSSADHDLLAIIMGHTNYKESLSMYGKATDEDKRKMSSIVNSL